MTPKMSWFSWFWVMRSGCVLDLTSERNSEILGDCGADNLVACSTYRAKQNGASSSGSEARQNYSWWLQRNLWKMKKPGQRLYRLCANQIHEESCQTIDWRFDFSLDSSNDSSNDSWNDSSADSSNRFVLNWVIWLSFHPHEPTGIEPPFIAAGRREKPVKWPKGTWGCLVTQLVS